MAKGLGVITSTYPELKAADPESILKWANELIRILGLRNAILDSSGYGWEVENLTTKVKSLDASAASAATVREVLASLIQELKDTGKLSS